MFGSDLLEVVIGIVFIYILVSISLGLGADDC